MGTAGVVRAAPNPSPMTLDGTNTWVIAEPGSSATVVVDPGPDDGGICGAYSNRLRGGPAGAQIVLTHGHLDHSAARPGSRSCPGRRSARSTRGCGWERRDTGAGDVLTPPDASCGWWRPPGTPPTR